MGGEGEGLTFGRVKETTLNTCTFQNKFQALSLSFKFIQAYLLQVYDKYITKFGNMKHMMYHYSQLATAIRGEQWFDA